jgi:predicted DNA-binding transcriptional regulator AlpA
MDSNAVDSSNEQRDDKVRYDGAAAITGLKVATLQSMVCRRQIPHFRLSKRLVIFSKAELLAWMSERRVAGK